MAGLPCGAALAQGALPLLGAWSSQSQDMQTGGATFETDIYNADGTTIGSVKLANGMMMRVFGRYQARQIGPNQLQLDVQPVAILPRQMCVGSPAGPTNCQSFPLPPAQSGVTVTFLDGNTVQANNITSHRDASGGLSQVAVPELLTMAPSAPQPMPGPISLPDLCTLGDQQCFSGWLRTCERWPNGQANWMTGAKRCGD